MSQDQKTALDALLRELPLDLGGDLDVQRPLVEELMRQAPLADDVTLADRTLAGIAVVDIGFSGNNPDALIFYLHGGAFAMGSARAGAGLASELARRAHARSISVDYRLAPEHPFPLASTTVWPPIVGSWTPESHRHESQSPGNQPALDSSSAY